MAAVLPPRLDSSPWPMNTKRITLNTTRSTATASTILVLMSPVSPRWVEEAAYVCPCHAFHRRLPAWCLKTFITRVVVNRGWRDLPQGLRGLNDLIFDGLIINFVAIINTQNPHRHIWSLDGLTFEEHPCNLPLHSSWSNWTLNRSSRGLTWYLGFCYYHTS